MCRVAVAPCTAGSVPSDVDMRCCVCVRESNGAVTVLGQCRISARRYLASSVARAALELSLTRPVATHSGAALTYSYAGTMSVLLASSVRATDKSAPPSAAHADALRDAVDHARKPPKECCAALAAALALANDKVGGTAGSVCRDVFVCARACCRGCCFGRRWRR